MLQPHYTSEINDNINDDNPKKNTAHLLLCCCLSLLLAINAFVRSFAHLRWQFFGGCCQCVCIYV